MWSRSAIPRMPARSEMEVQEMRRNAARSPAGVVTVLTVIIGAVLACVALPSVAGASSVRHGRPGVGQPQAALRGHLRRVGIAAPALPALPVATSDRPAGGQPLLKGVRPQAGTYVARVNQ